MNPTSKQGHIYLAAPLFTRAEQYFNLGIGEYLREKGYSVFLPQEECAGVEGEEIYKTCRSGLRSAAIVVAILDGADADSGTCWECGHAVALDIPVIAVRTDFRNSGDTGGFNAMLYYSAERVVERGDRYLEEIIEAIESLGI